METIHGTLFFLFFWAIDATVQMQADNVATLAFRMACVWRSKCSPTVLPEKIDA